MSLAISSFGADAGRSGIGRYLVQILREFAAMDVQAEIFGFASERSIFAPPGTLQYREVPEHWRPLPANLYWHAAVLPFVLGSHDVLWLPSVTRRLTPWSKQRRVGTVHDLGTFALDGKYDPVRSFLLKFVVTPLLRGLDHILTVSEYSKTDIVNFAQIAPEKITVTPLGVDHLTYFPEDPEKARARLSPYLHFSEPYLLYVSRLEHPGKNHIGLLRAFERLKNKERIPHKLVLIGERWNGADIIDREVAAMSHGRDVIFPGFVPHEALPDAYRAAEIFVFPSLFEGFGLPVLEAMACAVPVVCSNRASLPEVAGDAALTFDPDDDQGLAERLAKLVGDPKLRARYSELGRQRSASFSWARTAHQTLEVLQGLS